MILFKNVIFSVSIIKRNILRRTDYSEIKQYALEIKNPKSQFAIQRFDIKFFLLVYELLEIAEPISRDLFLD